MTASLTTAYVTPAVALGVIVAKPVDASAYWSAGNGPRIIVPVVAAIVPLTIGAIFWPCDVLTVAGPMLTVRVAAFVLST
jgi:hypothetical protein